MIQPFKYTTVVMSHQTALFSLRDRRSFDLVGAAVALNDDGTGTTLIDYETVAGMKPVVGVLMEALPQEMLSHKVMTQGIALMRVKKSINAGQPVFAGSSGLTPNPKETEGAKTYFRPYVGVALEKGAEGDFISVLIK